jgi:hypothetical protein
LLQKVGFELVWNNSIKMEDVIIKAPTKRLQHCEYSTNTQDNKYPVPVEHTSHTRGLNIYKSDNTVDGDCPDNSDTGLSDTGKEMQK